MRRQSQAIAMDLRFYLYASEKGAKYNTYPDGAGRPSVLVEYTTAERRANASRRDDLLWEWNGTDPDGFRLWRSATRAMRRGGNTEPTSGWPYRVFELDGITLVDPCRYCRECRARR